MNRRSKLNLSPDEGVKKQRPAGFAGSDSNAFSNSKEADKPETETNWETNPEAISQAEEAGMTSWLNGKQLLKMTLVVAASGLALYFLKRRFF